MTEVDEVARRTRRRRKRRDNPTGEMPLREHLTELRNRLLKSGLAVAVGMVVGFLVYQPVMAELFRPVKEIDPEHRTLLQVTMEDAAAADAVFSMLMGEDVESRRTFIQQNAKDIRFLDV